MRNTFMFVRMIYFDLELKFYCNAIILAKSFAVFATWLCCCITVFLFLFLVLDSALELN